MPRFLFGCIFLFLLTSCTLTRAQDKANFPTSDEINLMLTQADRAVQQYKPLIDAHERLLGKKAQEAATKDRELVQSLEIAIKAFRKNPQGFNGPLGFAFFEWIDDADRNALLCASGATNDATVYLIDGKVDQASELIHLAQSCSDAATLIYTVSENTGALYTRYVGGEEKLAQEGAKVAQECTNVLKSIKKKP
jgi:hypothetical protein